MQRIPTFGFAAPAGFVPRENKRTCYQNQRYTAKRDGVKRRSVAAAGGFANGDFPDDRRQNRQNRP